MFRFDRLVISLEKRALLYQRFSFLFVLVDWETAHCVHCVKAWFGWLTVWLLAVHSVMITAGIAATNGTTDGQWGVTLLCVQLAVLERISGCIHKGIKSPCDWFNHVIYSRGWMYGCKLKLCVCAHLFVSACLKVSLDIIPAAVSSAFWQGAFLQESPQQNALLTARQLLLLSCKRCR